MYELTIHLTPLHTKLLSCHFWKIVTVSHFVLVWNDKKRLNYLNIKFSHILLCNLLSTILKPNFEEPLDTAKQLVDRNIILYMGPGYEYWQQFLLGSPIPEYKILGESFTVAPTWNHYYDYGKE